MEIPIILLENINSNYPSGKSAFNQLDFKFYSGVRIGLMAPNGRGKKTIFHLTMGLIRPTSGHMELFSKTVTSGKDFEEAQ